MFNYSSSFGTGGEGGRYLGYQFMFRSPKQRLGRLGIIEGQGQASVLVFSIMG